MNNLYLCEYLFTWAEKKGKRENIPRAQILYRS